MGQLYQIEEVALDATSEMIAGSLAAMVNAVYQNAIDSMFWWGAVAAPDTTNAIDDNINRPFQLTSGANAYGTAVSILGTGDDPIPIMVQSHQHIRRLLVTASSVITPWKLRFTWGSGTPAECRGLGQYTEVMIISGLAAALPSGIPFPVSTGMITAGWKAWAEGWSLANVDTIDFFYGAIGHTGV